MNDLFAAIATHDQAVLARILAADPATAGRPNENGVTPILAAAYRGNAAAVEALRATGVELDVFEAAAVGDAARMKELLAEDPASAQAFGPDGFHALGLASFFHHFDVVQVLLAAGADVRAASRNHMQVTALHSAVADGGDRESALALIAAGADPNAKQRHGWTPLHGAADSGDRPVVEALLAASADPTLANDDGKLAIDIAREKGHAEIVALLEQVAASTD